MNIPNVCMRWAHRRAICKFCEKEIATATPVVVVFFWNKGQDGRRWNVKYYYHPNCWVAQGLDYLKMNPYVSSRRWDMTSKKENPLTEEQRKKRYQLLRAKASLEQRRRGLKSETENRALIEAKINVQIGKLMMEIIKVGGIPRKWLE